jgi:hypothetical protein
MFGRKKRVEAVNVKINQLENIIVSLQDQVDILSYRDPKKRRYLTRKEQINETRRKYRGCSEFGNIITQRLVNLRVAFSMPNRLFLMPNKNLVGNINKEMMIECKDYLKKFMELNHLDGSVPRDLAKEAELQGQVALGLVWDAKEKNVRLKYLPVAEIDYTVESAEPYLLNGKKKLTYEGGEIEKINWNDDQFVFIAFNDELNTFIGYPTCGGILEIIENLDKDLIDWRKLNHLFAHPTPHFKCETKDDADAVNALIRKLGWKVGTAIATNSDFNLKGTTGVESNLLMLSITTNAKIISAHTGIAIHFLGFANVMTNRATADDMGEPTEVVLHSEINSWNTFYYDLFRKVIRLRNEKLNGQLEENYIVPKIIPLTDKQYDLIRNVYLPLAEKNLIAHKTLLEQIPGLDVDEEEEKLEEQIEKAADMAKQNALKAENKETQEADENGEEEEEKRAEE